MHKLDKKDVRNSFFRWTFFSHSNYNYERLQATGVIHAFSPILKKLYNDRPKEMKKALLRHMNFFNTEPHFGGVILSLVIAMEEDRADGAPITDEAINGIKTGLMGPLAGIGDTLYQGTLIPILLAFGISLSSQGNILGPIVYTVMLMGILLSIAYIIWMKGYEVGKEGIEKVLKGNLLQKIITGSSAMGAIVLGALSASFVTVSSPLAINLGNTILSVQEDILDKLFLGLLPLLTTLLTFYLLKSKQMKSTKVMLILIIIGTIGGLLNII